MITIRGSIDWIGGHTNLRSVHPRGRAAAQPIPILDWTEIVCPIGVDAQRSCVVNVRDPVRYSQKCRRIRSYHELHAVGPPSGSTYEETGTMVRGRKP